MLTLAAEEWAKPMGTLLAAAGALYGGARVATVAMAASDRSTSGTRAAAGALPIAATALAAVVLHQPHIAVAVIFGSSVACLSLVLGLMTFMASQTRLPQSRRVWPFIFPAALLTMMAGFSAHLTWLHAFMLLLLGGAFWSVWQQETDAAGPAHPAPGKQPRSLALLMLAIVLLVIGAALAIRGTLASSSHARGLSPATLAATVLSALLVLPTLGASSTVAQAGQWGEALTALVGTVLLNLCLLLPITIILWAFRSTWPIHSAEDLLKPFDGASALPYLAATWRIETVMLVVLGFALVPVSMGRWAVSKLESGLLVLGYAVYVIVLAVFGVQMGG